ncbi:cysteine-rich receptor-like protein kinase 10 [Cryptomeria japonica]|uniref:cysteine-rich receptor-like protein kinase 10 n=1 Tax=Cryptomeria japonica TaxID=3369 RepID=UPI0027DA1D43|nr:cysteine-rich receptor-like protein kinase 10 [Cryptomeria japonica]
MQIAYNTKFQQMLCVSLLLDIAILFIVTGAISNCNPDKYKSSNFEMNLEMVLNDLVNHTSTSNGFNTSVSGQNPDKAFGLLQCRGDTTEEGCLSCSKDAISTARQVCGNATGSRFWLEPCFLRYENFNFVGQLSTNGTSAYSPAKVKGDPAGFSMAVKALFTNLSDAALRSSYRYASGQTIVSSFYQIFAIVQCWRDISSVEDCNTCLKVAIRRMLEATDDGTHEGGWGCLGSCIAHYEISPFFTPAPPPPPPPLQMPSRPSLTPKKSSIKKRLVWGIVSSLFVILILCLFAIRKKLKSAIVLRKPASTRKENLYGEVDSTIEHETIFNLENIKAATRNFHDDNKLGEGGFGTVYKGTMSNGTHIAVKKHSVQSLQGKEQFLNEVNLIAKIQHRNLVNLLGCCIEGLERLLVYEFLPNNSLDKILFYPEKSKTLDWYKRLNIILGVARGILYLHEDSQFPIIHRDIKASNILLDEKMEPKISDFGLARLFCRDDTHVNTRVAGTFGYMAPEYALGGQLSTKADVYSFGVVVLEIICGRKNIDNSLFFEFQSLLEWVWGSYREGNTINVIDKDILESVSREEVSRCIHVGLLCTQANASLRPPMSKVYAMLSNNFVGSLPEPTKPAYVSVTQTNTPSLTSTSISTSIRIVIPSSSTTHLV